MTETIKTHEITEKDYAQFLSDWDDLKGMIEDIRYSYNISIIHYGKTEDDMYLLKSTIIENHKKEDRYKLSEDFLQQFLSDWKKLERSIGKINTLYDIELTDYNVIYAKLLSLRADIDKSLLETARKH